MRFPSQHFRRRAFDFALDQLRSGRPGESGYGRRIGLLLTIPAFDDPVARDIRRATSGELYVVRTVWQRALDLTAAGRSRDTRPFVSPMTLGVDPLRAATPSLVSSRIDVEPGSLEALLDAVASSRLVCRPQHDEPRFDATIFELTFGEELTETRYRWSGPSPDGWQALSTFSAHLIRLVDEPSGIGTR